MTKKTDRVLAKGSYQKPKAENGLATLLLRTSEDSVETYDVSVSARFIGSVLVGEYSSERRGYQQKARGLLSLIPNRKDFIAIIDPKCRTLRCLIDKELREFEVRD